MSTDAPFLLDQGTNAVLSGLAHFNQAPGGISQSYFENLGFYGQEMALDPSLFATDISDMDMASLGSTLDSFIGEPGAV